MIPPLIPQPVCHSEQIIRDTEAAKTRIYKVKGNELVNYHSSLLDEGYLFVGSHIDQVTRTKIGNGEYLDLVKLMQKDKLSVEEDNRMEIVNRGGMSYWVPISDRDSNSGITSYAKWEQAFRVFSHIYTGFHPHKTGELIQYNHIIQTAAQSYAWENVYRYDHDFRLHMSCYHLKRSWGVILQQAWSMFLKDKVSTPLTVVLAETMNTNQMHKGSCVLIIIEVSAHMPENVNLIIVVLFAINTGMVLWFAVRPIEEVLGQIISHSGTTIIKHSMNLKEVIDGTIMKKNSKRILITMLKQIKSISQSYHDRR